MNNTYILDNIFNIIFKLINADKDYYDIIWNLIRLLIKLNKSYN